MLRFTNCTKHLTHFFHKTLIYSQFAKFHYNFLNLSQNFSKQSRKNYAHYLYTFCSSYCFLLNIFFHEKIPLILNFYCFWREMVRSTRHEKSVSQSNHSNMNKPLHTFYFSHVLMLRTCFEDLLRVVCSRL